MTPPFFRRPASRLSFVRAALAVGAIAVVYSASLGCGSYEKPEALYELVMPASGPWEAGSMHPIRWGIPAVGTLDAALTLTVSHDSGATWYEVQEVPVEDRTFTWTVPEGFEKARLGLLFHRTDADGVLTDVALAESKDIAIVPSTGRTYTWEKVTDTAAFGPREGAGGVVHDGKMWLLGGKHASRFPKQTANDVWSSVDGRTWTEEKKNTFGEPGFAKATDWEGRSSAGYHTFGGKMWIVGGDAVQGRYQTDAWSSTDGKTWRREDIHTTRFRVSPSGDPYPAEVWPPVEEAQYGVRTGQVTGVLDGKLFVMGGQRIASLVPPEWPGVPAASLDDVWVSRDGASYEPVPTVGAKWSARGFVSEAPAHDGRLWLVSGGLLEDGAQLKNREYSNEVWSSRDGAAWESVVEEPPFARRLYATVKAFDGKLWVIGGSTSRYKLGPPDQALESSEAYYTADGRNWYSASPPPEFLARKAATAWVHDGALFVGSGIEALEDGHADVWKVKRAP